MKKKVGLQIIRDYFDQFGIEHSKIFILFFFCKCIRLLFAWHSELKSKKLCQILVGTIYSQTQIFFREIDDISRIFLSPLDILLKKDA